MLKLIIWIAHTTNDRKWQDVNKYKKGTKKNKTKTIGRIELVITEYSIKVEREKRSPLHVNLRE